MAKQANEHHDRAREELRDRLERASAEALGAVADLNRSERPKQGNPQITVEEFLGGGSARHIEAGRTAQKAGRDFEASLAKMHSAYRVRGICWLIEHAMPTRPNATKGPRPGKAAPGPPMRIVTGPAPVDFQGCLGPKTPWPGRAVYLEAKSCGKAAKRIPIIPDKQSRFGLRLKQWQMLQSKARDWGAVSLIVWRNGDRVGVLTPDRFTEAVPSSLEADLFHWLPVGSLDWWTPVEKAMVGKP